MISAHNDWESGHTPVTLGHAPWVPTLYRDAVREVAAAVRRAADAARSRAAAQARSRDFRMGS